ncbi:MAG: hypothetical protein LQ338_007263 [Usnochroma carphineum]|nr:MAG: hypothetical protein LQ338_007263 [Usnochroma carphineum]
MNAVQPITHMDCKQGDMKPMTTQEENQIPSDRGDVDRSAKGERPRRYSDGRKVRKRNSQGLFIHVVTVVSATYDSANHSWKYTVKDNEGKLLDGTVKESDLSGS